MSPMSLLQTEQPLTQHLDYPAGIIPAFVLVCFAHTATEKGPEDLTDPPFSAAVIDKDSREWESPTVDPGNFIPADLLSRSSKDSGVKAAVFVIPLEAGAVNDIILTLRRGEPVKILSITPGLMADKPEQVSILESLEIIDPKFVGENRENKLALRLMEDINELMRIIMVLLKGFEGGALAATGGQSDEMSLKTQRLLVASLYMGMRGIHQVGGDPLAWFRAEINRVDKILGRENDMILEMRWNLNLFAETMPWLPKNTWDGEEHSGG